MNRPRKLPPLSAIRTFEAIARHESFSKAANELNVTQGAVSKQLKSLEQWYGIALIHRTTKQLALTPAGRMLLEAASIALDQLHQTSERIRRKDANVLRIMVSPTIGIRWLFPRLPELQQLLPNTQLRITTRWTPAEKQSELELEAYDLIVQCAPRTHCDDPLLRTEELVPTCSPDLLQKHGSWKAVIEDSVLLHPTLDDQDWTTWLSRHPDVKVDPERGLNFDTLDMPITLATRGQGVALADPIFILDEIHNGQLVIPRTLEADSGWGYYLVRPHLSEHATNHFGLEKAIETVLKWLHTRTQEDLKARHQLGTLAHLVPIDC